MLKVIELFAGIGSQTQALKNLGVEHKVVAISEIDKYAIKSYEAIHGEVNNLGDICKMKKLPQCDLLTYSFPCQDISVAGKGEGIKEGTRSGLLLEVERLLEVSEKPKYLLLENVKNLVGKKNKPDFDRWCEKLESMGYTNYWQVLNAKHYGIPQNRERVFMVSIFGEHEPYRFPDGFDNGMRLKDLLEDEVDEKFYISGEKVEKLISQLKNGAKGTLPTKEYEVSSALSSREHRGQGWKEIVGTLCARDYKDPKVVAIPCITPDRVEKRQNGRRFKENGEPMFTLTGQDRHGVLVVDDTQGFDGVRTYENESPCLRSQRSGIKVMVKEATKQGFAVAGVGVGVAQTFTCSCNQAVIEPNEIKIYDIPQVVRVRKYEVDIEGLKVLLKNSKKNSNRTNKEISIALNQPITLVEHWFRSDSSFSIPDANTWIELKGLLNITTDYYDAQIMEFEEKEGIFEKSNRVYDINGIAPTLTAASANEKILSKIPLEAQQREPKIIQAVGERGNHSYSIKDHAFTIPANPMSDRGQLLINNYRIRKLTPLECWRLMGFKDEQFQKAVDAGVSNSQLYKQAGNSIVVDVLEHIFMNLFKEGTNEN